MLIQSERHLGGWYQGCAICSNTFLTMDPQPVLLTERDDRVGWVCDTCLRLTPEDVRGCMGRKATALRRQAELLEELSANPVDEAERTAWVNAAAALPEEDVDRDRETYEADRS